MDLSLLEFNYALHTAVPFCNAVLLVLVVYV